MGSLVGNSMQAVAFYSGRMAVPNGPRRVTRQKMRGKESNRSFPAI